MIPDATKKMAALEELEAFVKEKIEQDGWTHKQLSSYLQQTYPGKNGFSVRSIERYCSLQDIHRTSRITKENLDEVIANAIEKVIDVLTTNNLDRSYNIEKSCSWTIRFSRMLRLESLATSFDQYLYDV